MTSSVISISTIKNAIGSTLYHAGGSITNIAIGNSAGKALSNNSLTTYSNTIVGDKAMTSLVTGATNTIVGAEALNVTGGSGNVAIGMRAGVPSGVHATATNCVAIGHNSSITNDALNQIAIGYGATCPDDNAVQLGNSEVEYLYCGATVITQGSDVRLKEDIHPADLESCTRSVLQLPVTRYKYKDFTGNHVDKHVTGWLADDVEVVFPKSVHTVDKVFPVLDKDGQPVIDEDGNIKVFEMKDVKQITMTEAVPTLWGALQNALHRIEQLEAKISQS